MVKVEFTSDFATMKKGDVAEFDSMLASHLTQIDKVAKLYKEKKSSK
jgi:hypothetical protein